MRRHNDLKRRAWSKELLRRYLVVCEGEVTETSYFSDIRIQEKIPIQIKFISGATPKTLVERAVEAKRKSDRAAVKQRDEDQVYDEIWVVFDIDTHPFVAEAKQQAKDNAINVAVSNPCFELWALLHFQDQFAHVSADELRRLCRNHMPGYEKTLPCSELIPLYPKAHERALSLQKLHKSRGTPGGNPSTGVFELVLSIRAQRQAWNQTANVQAAGADDHEDFLPLVDGRRRAAPNRPSKTST